MNRSDFADWLNVHGCRAVPIEGINHTGRQIKFINNTGQYAYVDLPLDEREIPDYFIIHTCKRLLIDYPDSVQHQEPLYNQLKTKFDPKNK
jgi:hypothetical protein